MYENLARYAGALAVRETSSAFGAGTLGLEDFTHGSYGLEGFADTGYHDTLGRVVLRADVRRRRAGSVAHEQPGGGARAAGVGAVLP